MDVLSIKALAMNLAASVCSQFSRSTRLRIVRLLCRKPHSDTSPLYLRHGRTATKMV